MDFYKIRKGHTSFKDAKPITELALCSNLATHCAPKAIIALSAQISRALPGTVI